MTFVLGLKEEMIWTCRDQGTRPFDRMRERQEQQRWLSTTCVSEAASRPMSKCCRAAKTMSRQVGLQPDHGGLRVMDFVRCGGSRL